MSIEKQLL
ncbi:hypothetical protein VTJ04DRAFT_6980 [Mycothermus thermophilus]